jgi:hypothetical protein
MHVTTQQKAVKKKKKKEKAWIYSVNLAKH